MLFSMILAATVAEASPGDIFQVHPDAHHEFQEKMKDCASLYGWTKCYEVAAEQFGTTGKERVVDWLDGIELVFETSGREVTLSEGRLGVTYSIEIGAPIRGLIITDIDRDGVEDLLFEDTDGVRWVVPNEVEEEDVHRR